MMAPDAINPLSLEYRPGQLLSEETEPTIKDYQQWQQPEQVARYLAKLQEKLNEEAIAYARLRKVGGKKLQPTRQLQSDNIDNAAATEDTKQSGFMWPQFKQTTQQRIENIAVTNKPQKSQVYKNWEYSPDTSNQNIFYLKNPGTNQSIKICYDDSKINITTSKKDMQDNMVMTIMLELARNVQRYSNNYEKIKKINLSDDNNEEIKQINNKLLSYSAVLNQGVEDYFNSNIPKKQSNRPPSAEQENKKMQFE